MTNEPKDKRQAILAAALDLIAEQGFQNAPMSQIALRANAGVGTIYRYFSSKEDMINALYLEIKKQLTAVMSLNSLDSMPVRKAFRLIVGGMLELFIAKPQYLSFFAQYVNSPLITAATHEEGFRIMEPVYRHVTLAMEQEIFKPMPGELMGEMIYGAVASLAKYAVANGSADGLDAGIDAIWDMVRR